MGIYVKGVDMPKENEVLQIRIYDDGKVSRVYDIKCQQIGTAIETTQVVPIEEVWANVQPLKDKILELEEKLYLQNEWIPCSKLLPKHDEAVLITTNKEIQIGTVGFDDEWYVWNGGRWLSAHNVTAWMPLPEPYRKENEE